MSLNKLTFGKPSCVVVIIVGVIVVSIIDSIVGVIVCVQLSQ